jgi:hypothetical protein
MRADEKVAPSSAMERKIIKSEALRCDAEGSR